MGAHAQRLVAVDGTMTDSTTFDWKTLNTDDPTVTLTTKLGRPTFIELDLGVGGQLADNVRIVHPTGNMAASNNTVLYVMNEQRMVIMQNVFTITSTSPQTENFPIGAVIPQPTVIPVSDIQTVRLLHVIRPLSGGVHLNSLQLRLGSHKHAYLYKRQSMWVAPTVFCNGWRRLAGQQPKH